MSGLSRLPGSGMAALGQVAHEAARARGSNDPHPCHGHEPMVHCVRLRREATQAHVPCSFGPGPGGRHDSIGRVLSPAGMASGMDSGTERNPRLVADMPIVKPEVGQTIFAYDSMGRRLVAEELVVRRIGRDYFYATRPGTEGGSWEHQFHLRQLVREGQHRIVPAGLRRRGLEGIRPVPDRPQGVGRSRGLLHLRTQRLLQGLARSAVPDPRHPEGRDCAEEGPRPSVRAPRPTAAARV